MFNHRAWTCLFNMAVVHLPGYYRVFLHCTFVSLSASFVGLLISHSLIKQDNAEITIIRFHRMPNKKKTGRSQHNEFFTIQCQTLCINILLIFVYTICSASYNGLLCPIILKYSP